MRLRNLHSCWSGVSESVNHLSVKSVIFGALDLGRLLLLFVLFWINSGSRINDSILRECMRGCQNVLALAFCRHLSLLAVELDP